jgi:hypothetical protein
MYNEDIKKRYIEEKENAVVMPNNYLTLQFNHSEEYEIEIEKDISNFTTYEILEYYKIRNFISLDSLNVLNSQLSLYTQWCLQNNLVIDNQNHFLEINLEMLKNCINKLVISKSLVDRQEFLKLIKELPNPKDQFILLSLFEVGKSKDFKDIVTAKITDIKENTLTLFDGREVQISDELKNIALESYGEDTYYSISGKGMKKMPLIVVNNQIVRSYPNVKNDVSDFQKGRVIYSSCVRSLKYLGVEKWMSANSIVEAGKLDMIKRRSTELNMSMRDYIYSDYISEVEHQYGCKIVRSIYVKKYSDYLD